jgi:ATP-dependent helicase/DNAse subunit B
LAKEIWLGPLLGNNRSRLIERCADLVSQNKSNSFLYLAASHPLLELVTQGILDGELNRGVWGELPVYLFRGFVRRLLATAVDEQGQPLTPRVPIDREELPLKRSLIAQILARLSAAGQLKAIGPLANREGCINTIATLIGEIERAAKSPAEVAAIIANRTQEAGPQVDAKVGEPARQIDFDQEVALIYSTYCELLERHQLTEADADAVRALAVLNGEFAGHKMQVPWLSDVQLLVLDGFFDFTPVQGEILRRLIPMIPDVLVNLNHDERNQEIFLPFQDTIEHLTGIAPFEKKWSDENAIPTNGALSGLRENLFNLRSAPGNTPGSAGILPASGNAFAQAEAETGNAETRLGSRRQDACAPKDQGAPTDQSEIRYFECGDRETEIRTVAKEIKRLVVHEGVNLTEIALVVRQRASYAETIARVMREESLPCNLESRIEANDIPGLRAALKLFATLEQLARDETNPPRLSHFADLIKSEYFRLSKSDIETLAERFDEKYSGLLSDSGQLADGERERLKRRHRIGVWDADALENAFAYVGSDLPVKNWLKRAQKLIEELPAAAATRELLNIDSGEQVREPDEADQIENAETAKVEDLGAEKKRRPSRDIHPAALAWTALVIQTFAERLHAVPREGTPVDLRGALMSLLEQFGFREQIATPISDTVDDEELPQAMLNFNSLEALRRAFLAAIKSIELSEPPAVAGGSMFDPSRSGINHDPPPTAGGSDTKLSTFIEEVRRSLGSQSHPFGGADTRGLRVLEATDVRGLRFRVVFIAGLVEGGFPLRAARDWIYPHEERERLKKAGLTLEDISPATLLKEEHYFYQAACRATDRLYLSRPLSLADDSETVASYYLDELRRAVAPLEIKAETIRRDYEGQHLADVSSNTELNIALVRQEERHLQGSDKRGLLAQPRIKRLLTLARNDYWLSDSALRRIEIERERAGDFFGPYDGEITDPQLLALLKQKFGSDFPHSASGLSLYGNCAYRFFGQRVLRLEPRGEAALDLQAIDAGKLLHDILRRFFEKHRRQRLYELDRKELQDELRELADGVFDEHERVVPPLNQQIWKIDREIRKILLDQVLLYELEIQEKAADAGVVPAYFEIAFGGMKANARDPDSTETPLELSRSTFVGEETMKINGQIDRVDVASDQTLIAYDYKLSMGSSKDDIRLGRSLQLPIYLEALEKLILPDHPIAGGGYYVIRGGSDRRNKGLYRASGLPYSKIGAKVSAVMADDEWQQIRAEVIAKIWDFLDRMRAGQFTVDPSEKKKTCRFCDFGAVCRYDRYRIDRKKSAADYSEPSSNEVSTATQ